VIVLAGKNQNADFAFFEEGQSIRDALRRDGLNGGKHESDN
jgi:hypothetical protein